MNLPITHEEQTKAIILRNKLLPLLTNKPKYLLSSEINKLFTYITDSKQLFFFQLLWNTGVRKTEALNLIRTDIDLENKVIIVNSLKKKNPEKRIVPISDLYFINLINNYLSFGKFKPGQKLFDVTPRLINIWLNNIVEKAKADSFILPFKVTPHTFRHSYAIHLLYNRVDLLAIKSILGHASISATKEYVEILSSDVDLSKIRFTEPV